MSVKALRVYHEMGLLVPAVVDPETGYRAYSPAQLTDAAIIRLLREVGVSLQDISAVLLPISAPVLVAPELGSAGVRVDELPACDVAVLELRGSYAGLESCYRRLGTWVAFHAVPADPPVRELYLTPVGGPEEDQVTDLLWPIVIDQEH